MTTPQGYLGLAVGISCTAQAGACPAVARISCSWLPREVFTSKLAQFFFSSSRMFSCFSPNCGLNPLKAAVVTQVSA